MLFLYVNHLQTLQKSPWLGQSAHLMSYICGLMYLCLLHVVFLNPWISGKKNPTHTSITVFPVQVFCRTGTQHYLLKSLQQEVSLC